VQPQGIRIEAVTRWLLDHIEDVRAPFGFELIAGGRSNLTFRVLDADGRALVLRRPPLGHVLQSAHDVGREHRIIAALAGSGVPVAPALGLCDDPEVNEAPFYVMAFVDGDVLATADDARALPAAERMRLGFDVADVLGRLHRLDPDAVGLGTLGRKEAYLTRQLKRWSKQWAASKLREIPEMEETARRLEARMPEQKGAAIVHGDYRLGNLLVADGAIRAVLDWELCTLGDPLADIGYLLNDWIPPEELPADAPSGPPTAAGGFPDRDALLARYASASGRDLEHIDYYRAFAHWRLAAIGEGVYRRYKLGAMGEQEGVDLDALADSVVVRARAALALTS
jgi:aminoglycoside phosphotransferase (APT) family kinase protein